MPVDARGKEVKVGQLVAVAKTGYVAVRLMTVTKINDVQVRVKDAIGRTFLRYPNDIVIVEEAPNGQEEA